MVFSLDCCKLLHFYMLLCPVTTAVLSSKSQPWVGDLMSEVILVECVSIVIGHEHLVAHGAKEFIVNFRFFVRGFLPDAKLVIFAEGILCLKGFYLLSIATFGNLLC